MKFPHILCWSLSQKKSFSTWDLLNFHFPKTYVEVIPAIGCNCWVTKYHQHLGDSNRHSKNNRGILETSRLHVMNIFLVKCILLKLLWLCCLAMDFAHTSWQSSTQRKCRQPSAILKLSDSGFHLPFGKLTVCYGKIHHFQLVNPRTKWPFSIAM